MREVFLALKPAPHGPLAQGMEGTCAAQWLNDPLLVAQFIKDGWVIYRCNGFEPVDTFTIELRIGAHDVKRKSPKSSKSDN